MYKCWEIFLSENWHKMLFLYLPLKIYFSSLFFCQTEEEAFIKIYTSAKLIRHHLLSSKSPVHLFYFPYPRLYHPGQNDGIDFTSSHKFNYWVSVSLPIFLSGRYRLEFRQPLRMISYATNASLFSYSLHKPGHPQYIAI